MPGVRTGCRWSDQTLSAISFPNFGCPSSKTRGKQKVQEARELFDVTGSASRHDSTLKVNKPPHEGIIDSCSAGIRRCGLGGLEDGGVGCDRRASNLVGTAQGYDKACIEGHP